MTQTITGYPVYTRGQSQYCWIPVPVGNDYWAMNLDYQKPSKFVPLSERSKYTRGANDAMYTEGQLDQQARQRRQIAQTQLTNYFRQQNNFRPMPFALVIYLLEAEYISALAAQAASQDQGADATRVNTAGEKLVLFWKRHHWDYDRFSRPQNPFYGYSLEDNFVGETAHIHGCYAIYKSHGSYVRFHCNTQDPALRFRSFMEDVPEYDGVGSDTKTRINETLLAPRTVEDPPGVHQSIYKSFVAHLTDERKQELVQWVGSKFQPHGQGAAVVRVGVWIRNVAPKDNHTDDQNMSKARLQRILAAAAAAGVHEVILLGDGWPSKENWLQGSQYAVDPGANQGRAYKDFLRLWEKGGIPPLDPADTNYQGHADPAYHRGYAEQALTYAALYRNPDANINVNMACIITNKSGGPDLPSLAGVPQIQIAEMAEGELFIHHRMGFQSLCSPMWTVLRVPQRDGQPMTLTGPQGQELTTLIQRSVALRQWHMTALGNDRYTW